MGVRHALVIFSLLLAAPDRVSISVTPSAVPVGGSIRLTCTVPHNPDNRWLVMGAYYEGGIVFKTSERQLDGDQASITHVFQIPRVACDVAIVDCYLIPAVGRQYHATREIVVAGCSQ